MTQIIKEEGKTIIKTGDRIDTRNAAQFEEEIKPAFDGGTTDIEIDCGDLTYVASSGLRVIQWAMRAAMSQKRKLTLVKVRPEIYKILAMTGFTRYAKVEQL